jgi:2,3-bisphosphoglycerate-dependent phosphoglycerate mutase
MTLPTTLIIARHGNTFGPCEEPRRVGRRTDIPLVARGRAQALALGCALAGAGLVPGRVVCARLKRARETAALAVRAAGWRLGVRALALLDEVDYGPDEGAPEWRVLARIGPGALAAWEGAAVPPPGWRVDPPALRRGWRAFADGLEPGTTTLAVTSNGTARFAPAAGGKLATGAYGVLTRAAPGAPWVRVAWNVRP